MEGHNLASEIKGFMEGLERSNPDLSATARVKRAWNVVVDEHVREHVNAVFVVPNTNASEVIIYVDTAIWAVELGMQEELLKLKMNIELQAEQIEKIKFFVSKEQYSGGSKKRNTFDQLDEEEKKLKSVQPIELDEEELAPIQEAAAHIEDDRVRNAAYAAAKASLEWQKGLEKVGA